MANNARTSNHRAGFSLIELLVVVGIIAILMTILFPTLGRVRERARTVHCLSNLRQVHTYFVAYAATNDGQVPIGYKDVKASNYNWVDTAAPKRHAQAFGLLFTDDSKIDPKTFFCPAETNPGFQFDAPENRTPSSVYPNGSISPLPFGLIRSGYGCRPSVRWSSTSSAALGRMPRLADLGGLAMFGDSPQTTGSLAARHPKGANILYANGSARWVEKSAFIDNLKKAEAAGAYTVAANKFYLNDANDTPALTGVAPVSPAAGMWADFDRN